MDRKPVYHKDQSPADTGCLRVVSLPNGEWVVQQRTTSQRGNAEVDPWQAIRRPWPSRGEAVAQMYSIKPMREKVA